MMLILEKDNKKSIAISYTLVMSSKTHKIQSVTNHLKTSLQANIFHSNYNKNLSKLAANHNNPFPP